MAMRIRLLIGILFITTAFSPLVANQISPVFEETLGIEFSEEPEISEDMITELPGIRIVESAGGRAPCPTIQSDAGVAGDAGNTSNTSRPLGQNPTTSKTGCMDATDTSDWYSFSYTSGKDIDVELVVPASMDFDLYLWDDSTQSFEDYSEYNDPLEKVTSIGSSISGVAGTYYIRLHQWSGDGTYTLRTWTNDSPPTPDLTATSVLAPARANASDTVSVTYTIDNIGDDNSSTFDVAFILSEDETYSGWTDTLLSHSETHSNIAPNGSLTHTANVTLPSNLADGSYHWIIWPDGYGNVTEGNESNNYMASPDKMTIGMACEDLHTNGQDDGGLGDDAPANWSDVSVVTGDNYTGTLNGCMDGNDGNDNFRFDVPHNYNLFARITTTGNDRSYLDLHSFNGTYVDWDYSFNTTVKEISSEGSTDYDATGGTFYLNITHSDGVGNYTLDVWTNYSVPKTNLYFEEVSGPLSSNPGDMITISGILGNNGNLDLSNSTKVSAWLSVSNDWSKHDHEIGNTTISSLGVNQTQSVQVNGVIPSDIIEGNYSLMMLVDEDETLDEKNEEDNEGMAEDMITVGNYPTSCPSSQNDALSGGDAGNDANNAYDLGTDPSVEVIGCADNNADTDDYYKVTMSSGMDLEAVLITAPGADFDIYLKNSMGQNIDFGLNAASNDEFVETTDGAGGTFYLQVSAYSDAGEYRLIINDANDIITPAFNCGEQMDLGLAGDASDASTNPTELGDNPMQSGMGCMDSDDVADAYGFGLTDRQNVVITFTQGLDTNFMISLYEGSNFIDSWDNTTSEMNWGTMDTEREGTDSDYRVVIGANGHEGFYNLTVTTTAAALPDFWAVAVSCPIDLISGDEASIGWEVSNIDGVHEEPVNISVDLIDSMGDSVLNLYSGTVNFTAMNANMESGSSVIEIPEETSSDIYTCQLEIDPDMNVEEENESNNLVVGQSFNITNYWDLWANDLDQDGFNTTDVGDGIVDACPDTYGESTGDVYGCPDIDGDGWSNTNDVLPLDESQWSDTDGDGYPDNPNGTDGDQCPEVAGVQNGEGGQGCPIAAPTDSDEDGVFDEDDQCPDTPSMDIVDEDGCTITDDGEGSNGTGGGDVPGDDGNSNDNNEPGDDGTDSGDDGESDSQSDGENVLGLTGDETMEYGMLAGAALVIILLVILILRGRGEDDEVAINQAFNAGLMGGAMDPYGGMMAQQGRSAEAMAYEQQLIASGYDAATARAYADHYFNQ